MLIPLLEALVIAGCLAVAGGAIGAILATFTTHQEIRQLWDAHNRLWERTHSSEEQKHE